MNAEDCPEHEGLIDEPEGGIYYPWICECAEGEDCDSGTPA